jgi:hypothetical protein
MTAMLGFMMGLAPSLLFLLASGLPQGSLATPHLIFRHVPIEGCSTPDGPLSAAGL